MIKIKMPDNETIIQELESEVARLGNQLTIALEALAIDGEDGCWCHNINQEALKKIQELREE